MKLDELLGVKKFYDKHLDDVKKAFVSNGSLYKKLGSGATATAYAQGDEYVYKFWLMDTAYEKYVDYCLDNQDNPHVPVLYSDIKNLHSFFARTSDFPDKIRYIKMERLTPLKDNTKWPGVTAKNSKNKFYTYVETIIDFILESIQTGDDINSISDFKKEMFNDPTVEIDVSDKAWKDMYEIFKIMLDLFHTMDYHADYHAGNIMMRGDTVVITDPYCDDESIELSDDIAGAMYKLSFQLKKKAKSPKKNKSSEFVNWGEDDLDVITGPKSKKE